MSRPAIFAILFAVVQAGCADDLRWSPPERIGTANGCSQVISRGTLLPQAATPRLAVGPRGELTAVWATFDGSRGALRAARYTRARGWATPEPIQVEGVVGCDPSGSLSVPAVASDSAGTLFVAWNGTGGMWAKRFTPAAGWTPGQRIGPLQTFPYPPAIAMNDGGDTVVAWTQNDGGQRRLWAARFHPSTGWDTAQRVDPDVTVDESPSIAVDPAGNAVLVCEAFNGVWSSRFMSSGRAWTPAETLSGPVDFPNSSDVASDSSGRFIAVWDGRDGVRSARFLPGAGWTSPTVLSLSGSLPRIGVDAAGEAFAVWYQEASDPGFEVRASHSDVANGWIASTRIGRGLDAVIALDGRGSAIAAWVGAGEGGDPFENHIFANRFEPSRRWGTPTRIQKKDAPPPSVSARDALPRVHLRTTSDGETFAAWMEAHGDEDDPEDVGIWVSRFGQP
jgi:hypothetical protein